MAVATLPIKHSYREASKEHARVQHPEGPTPAPQRRLSRMERLALGSDDVFPKLADLPIDAIEGMNEAAVAALQAAFNVRTIRELAEHELIQAAVAITMLADAEREQAGGRAAATAIRERPGVSGGYPVVGDTRIAVRLIVEAYRQVETLDDTVEAFPQLSREQVSAALDYYRANPGRVDEDIERNARTLSALRGG